MNWRTALLVSLLWVGAESPHCRAAENDALQPIERLPVTPRIYSLPTYDDEPMSVTDGASEAATSDRDLASFTVVEHRRDLGRRERLIDRATDPTAWLMEFHFRDQFQFPVGDPANNGNQFQFRPTVPFLAFDQVNLFRAYVEYDINNPSSRGLNNIRIADLVIFEESWGRWGVGPVVRLKPNATSRDEFQIGPAAALAAKNQHWTYGFIMQNFFGDGVAQSYWQPILAYKFDDRWSLSAGETEIHYDWRDGQWTQLPIGCSLAYISDLCGQKIRWFVNPQYNFPVAGQNAEWLLNFGVDLLAPDA